MSWTARLVVAILEPKIGSKQTTGYANESFEYRIVINLAEANKKECAQRKLTLGCFLL
jgi:hypothetical protein